VPSHLTANLVAGRRRHFWIAAIGVLVLDQFTKLAFVGTHVAPGAAREDSPIVLIPGFLNLIARWNTRSAFSLGPDSAFFYMALTLAGLALVGYFFWTSPPGRLRPHLALGLVAGGAAGNLIDRILFHAVRDMIDAHLPSGPHWPTFNIADSAICIGVGLLIIEAFGKGEGSCAAQAEAAHRDEAAPPRPARSARKRTGTRR
jgi:signal peptidase II